MLTLPKGWHWSRGEQGWGIRRSHSCSPELPCPGTRHMGLVAPLRMAKPPTGTESAPRQPRGQRRAPCQPCTQACPEQLHIPPCLLGREGRSWNEDFIELHSSLFVFSFHFFHSNLVVFSRAKSWRQRVLYILQTLDGIQLP